MDKAITEHNQTLKPSECQLVFDGDCPICQFSVLDVVKPTMPHWEYLNARETNPLVEQLWHQGVNLNQGFCLIINDQRFVGWKAMQIICQRIEPSKPWWAIAIIKLARLSYLARVMYPIMVFIRSLLLRWRGIKPLGSS